MEYFGKHCNLPLKLLTHCALFLKDPFVILYNTVCFGRRIASYPAIGQSIFHWRLEGHLFKVGG